MTSPFSINPLSALLEKRRLTAAEGLLMGLDIVQPLATEGDLGYVPGGKIKHLERLPYFDLTGNPIKDPKNDNREFVRYRIERPSDWIPTPKGTVGANGKPIKDAKYLSPRESSTFAYLPRVDGIDWTEVAANPSIPVMITEGEFKAYTMCKAGFYCIGLTGVQAFGRNGEPFPYPLSEFSQLGREWQIVFDADSESDFENPLKLTVAQAAMRLASKLALVGANPHLLHIARTPAFLEARTKDPHAKLGLDDYLFAEGTPEQLIATKTRAIECQDMAYLRSTYAYYTGEAPHIVNVLNGHVYKTTVFVKELEANKIRLVERANGAPQKVRVASEFIDARDRPEIDRKVFWPHASMGYDAEARIYNEWRGFAVEGFIQSDEKEAYNEVVAIWKKFIRGLCGEHDWYFEKWLAHLFQFPGVKTTIAVIMATPMTGIGKSLMGEIIRGMIGGESSVAMELGRATKDFNSLLSGKIFIQMDEAEGKFAGHESKLKDMITADTAIIEKKMFDAVVVDNFCRIFMTSNSVSPIRLDAEERRYLVLSPEMTKAEVVANWGPWIGSVVAKQLKSPQGLRLLRCYLNKVDLTGWEPTARVVMTPAALDMIDAGRTKSSDIVEGLWEALSADPVGWWALSSELKGKDSAMWANLVARIKSEGGQSLRHKVKDMKAVTILDPKGALPKHMPPSEKQWWLDNKELKLPGDEIKSGAVRAQVAWEKWDGLVPRPSSKKF